MFVAETVKVVATAEVALRETQRAVHDRIGGRLRSMQGQDGTAMDEVTRYAITFVVGAARASSSGRNADGIAPTIFNIRR
jgi:hypothetical protein